MQLSYVYCGLDHVGASACTGLVFNQTVFYQIVHACEKSPCLSLLTLLTRMRNLEITVWLTRLEDGSGDKLRVMRVCCKHDV